MGRKVHDQKPEWMIIYDCPQCGMDSGLTENQEPLCFYCQASDLIERERKSLTPEVLAERMKLSADRVLENLQKAYDAKPEDLEEEKELLQALADAKSYKKKIYIMADKMVREHGK